MGGARQHAVFRCYPTLALPFQKTGDLLFYTGSAQHARMAKLHQYGSFRMVGKAASKANRAQLIGETVAGAHGKSFMNTESGGL